MRYRTKDKLLWTFTFLSCIGLGILSKFAFDTSWWAAPVFAFGSFTVMFLVFQILDIIDNIMTFYQKNAEYKEKEKKVREDRARIYDNLSRDIPYDVRNRMVDQIIAENAKKKRLEDISRDIKCKSERIKELENELELYKQLAEEEGVEV